MASDLLLRVVSTGDTRGLDKTADALDDVGDEAKTTARRLDDVGDEAQTMARKILEAEVALKALAKQYVRTGDEAVKSDLKKQQSALNELKSLEKLVQPDKKKKDSGFLGLFANVAEESAQAGVKGAAAFGEAFEGLIGGVFKALPPEAQAGIVAGLIGAATLAAPLIAAVISGAILLGVGAAGIGAGIALAIKDPAVQGAFKDLGSHVMANLKDAAKPFRSELVATAHIFGAAFTQALPSIRGIFGTLAQAVQPLARGLAGLAVNALPGVQKAAEAAVPLIKQLAADLPGMGRALGYLFAAVADSGPAASETFHFIAVNVQTIIVLFGAWLKTMAPVIEGLAFIDKMMFGGKKSAEASAYGKEMSTSFDGIDDSAKRARRSVQMFTIDMDKLIGNQINAREAAIGFEEALDETANTLDRHNHSLDIGTESGRKNVKAFDDLINRARDHRQALLDEGKGLAEADAAYDSDIRRIKEMARQLGFSEGAIDQLIGTAKTIPRDIKIDVSVFGVGKAMGLLGSLGGAISRVTNTAALTASISKSLGRRAAGGPVSAGRAYIVGENRPELFVPSVNGTIVPSVQPSRPNASGGRSAGLPPMGQMEQILTAWLMELNQRGALVWQ